MLAFRVQKGKLISVERPLPKLRKGWALVRVRLAGICDTDAEILRGYHSFRRTPGHEFVGEVAEVAGVPAAERGKWMGRRVCGAINVTCSAYGFKPECRFCQRGLRTHCSRRTVLGIVAHDGAFAEYLTLPLENLHLVPTSVTDEEAVFAEPLAAACEIPEQVDLEKVRTAAVLGDGKLGQLIARVLKRAVPRVILYGKHRDKLEIARRAGLETRKVYGDSRDLARVQEALPLVVDATGSSNGLALAQQMTEPRGTLVLKSTFHGAATVETWPIVVKEIIVVGSRCGPLKQAAALLHAGAIDVKPLISRTFALAEAQQAMAFAERAGVLKVLLKP